MTGNWMKQLIYNDVCLVVYYSSIRKYKCASIVVAMISFVTLST